VELQKTQGSGRDGRYEVLAIKDIQDAADTLRPVYDRTKMRDGYVSLEVSPFLAKDTQGTIKDARRLWKAGEPAESDGENSGILNASRLSSSASAKASTLTFTLLFANG